MGGHIDCYLDVASFFSYVAFADLRPNLEALRAHGVTVSFQPVLIAGINALSGNKPPWLLPAKSHYLAVDSQRAAARVGLSGLGFPDDLMSMALTTGPMRALSHVREAYPETVFLDAMAALFRSFWTPPHVNLTMDENLTRVLLEATSTSPSSLGQKLFTADQVAEIMASRDAFKGVLKAKTEEVVKLGAFGAPWLWVTNDRGESQAFFGSDRFNHIYSYLGVPFQDITISPPTKESKL